MPYDEPEAGLTTPVRNRYVFGDLLGVADLEREQEYASAKRRLANRLLHGYGVVAGLDVELTGGSTITVSPGLAMDAWGREIVVVSPMTVLIPTEVLATAGIVEVVLCYDEVDGDPTPAIGFDESPPEASTIREVPRIDVRPAADAPPPTPSPPLALGPDGRAELARWITRSCDPVALPADPSVLLARATVTAGGAIDDVDIDVRPIVVSNALLLAILMANPTD